MEKFSGIDTVFGNAICPAPTADEQTGGGTKGGCDLRDGEKQSSAGETGTWVTTQDLPGQTGVGLARPSGMSGS